MGPFPVKLEMYRTAIPMRRFEHAAAARALAEAVVTRLTLSDGSAGWGETLPRKYVTGETLESVIEDIEGLYWNAPGGDGGKRPLAVLGDSFRDIGEEGRGLAMGMWRGRAVTAALCAVELAWRDALARSSGRSLCAAAPAARVSGVLGSSDPARTARQLRLMRLFGLRDFKLKLGLGEGVDAENLKLVHRRIGRAVAAGGRTLRVDVNGGWPADQTPQRVAALRQYGVCVVEQPAVCPAEALAELAQRCQLPLMADESMVTYADAARLIAAGGKKVWLNIRLSKNGGISGCLAIAQAAAAVGVPFVVGCMVGESSILSAGQRALLSLCPPPRFVEGNYGRFLLADDLTRRPLRFGYGGRLKAVKGPGLGVEVELARLQRYARLVKTLTAST